MTDIVWPVPSKYITSGYDLNRRLPLGPGGRMIDSPHAGLDMRAPFGQEVVFPVSGEIVRLVSNRKPGDSPATGTLAPWRSGNGFGVKYGNRLILLAHVSPYPRWRVGDHVSLGEPAGTVDLSGTITAAHLHIEDWSDWRDHRSHTDFSSRLTTKGSAVGTDPTIEKDWLNMATQEDVITACRLAVHGLLVEAAGRTTPTGRQVDDALGNIIAERALSGTYGSSGSAIQILLSTKAEIAALREVVSQLSTGNGTPIDYDKVDSIVRTALEDGVDVNIDVSVPPRA